MPSARPSSTKKKTAPKTPPPKKSALDQQVRTQLHALNQTLEEVARQYVLRLQREIEEVAQMIPEPRGSAVLAAAQVKRLNRMAELLSTLQIKPAKGRRKDLKKIDILIGELEGLIHAAPTKSSSFQK